MTQLLTTGGLGQAFRVSTDAASYQRFLTRHNDQERLRRERKAEVREEDAEALDFAVAAITATEIATFHGELALYDTATVTALQENTLALEHVQEKLDPFLGKAHVLPDGRRVFKTEDGLRVFDEYGDELDAQTINPDEIGDDRPYWEKVEPLVMEQKFLMEQRAELFDYQGKLDNARERLDAGDLSREEFDALREDLKADMPNAVRAQIPHMESEQKPELDTAATSPAADLDITDDMVPASFTSRGSAPTFGG